MIVGKPTNELTKNQRKPVFSKLANSIRLRIPKEFRLAIHYWLISGELRLRFYMKLRRDLGRVSIFSSPGIVIEGYPRSANSYAVCAFRIANGLDMTITSHTHSFVSIKLAVRYKIPTIVLVRNPIDAVASQWFQYPTVSLKTELRRYATFYKEILRYVEGIVLVPFESCISDFGKVIEAVNLKFASSFGIYEPSEENESRVREMVDELDATQRDSGMANPFTVSRPSRIRSERKKEAIEQIQQHPRQLEVALHYYHLTMIHADDIRA
jgi:hypothetical protein